MIAAERVVWLEKKVADLERAVEYLKRQSERRSEMATTEEMREALEAIVTALDVERNRMGKLMSSGRSGEPLRLLALKYRVAPAQDAAEQAVLVARAVLAKED